MFVRMDYVRKDLMIALNDISEDLFDQKHTLDRDSIAYMLLDHAQQDVLACMELLEVNSV